MFITGGPGTKLCAGDRVTGGPGKVKDSDQSRTRRSDVTTGIWSLEDVLSSRSR